MDDLPPDPSLRPAGAPGAPGAGERPDLPPAARRALAEAAARRARQAEAERARELGGREGPEPVRYGDWEKNGIASDF